MFIRDKKKKRPKVLRGRVCLFFKKNKIKNCNIFKDKNII